MRETGEFTEASYHYPQGVHLGHLLFALKIIGENKRKNAHFDDKYVRLRGNFDSGRVGAFQRQTKYKLQGIMEMCLIVDDRNYGPDEEYILELTPEGKKLYKILKPLIQKINLSFSKGDEKIPSWNMELRPQDFNNQIWNFIRKEKNKKKYVQKLFLNTHAASQMLNYLYRIERKKVISKSAIYSGFFKAPFVQMYCDQNGIEVATEEGAKHRCPFLINILEAIGVLTQTQNEVTLNKFLICKQTMQLHPKESEGCISKRIENISNYLSKKFKKLDSNEVSLLKEAFGKTFLSDEFYLKDYEILNDGGERDGK